MIIESKLIHGERVVLRPYEAGFTEEELYRMYRWSRDRSVLRWSGGSALSVPFEKFKDLFRHELRHPDKHRRVFCLLTDTGKLIGRLGYFNIDYRRGEAELGIVIGEKMYWGRGYGTDATKALLIHIFEETDLKRVYLYTYAENKRARRCFEKCGFRKVGRNHKFSLKHGSHDEIKMEIRRDEWSAQQGSVNIGHVIKGDHHL